MSAFDNALTRRSNNKALAGNIGGQHRVQEVLTSLELLERAIYPAFGGRPGLDPCAPSRKKNWFAQENWTLGRKAQQLDAELARLNALPKASLRETERERQKELARLLKPLYLAGSLARPWGLPAVSVFCNPPYGFLQEWLRRCAHEALIGRQVIGLWPVRTHRKWWCKYHLGAQIICLSYDQIFQGHKHAFPSPLCLAAFNVEIPDLGAMETMRIRMGRPIRAVRKPALDLTDRQLSLLEAS